MCRPGGRRCPGIGYNNRAVARRRANTIYRRAAAEYADGLAPGLGDRVRNAPISDIPLMMDMISDVNQFGGITPARAGTHHPDKALLGSFEKSVNHLGLGNTDTLIETIKKQEETGEPSDAAVTRLAELVHQDVAASATVPVEERTAAITEHFDPSSVAYQKLTMALVSQELDQREGDPALRTDGNSEDPWSLALRVDHPDLSRVERELLLHDAATGARKSPEARTAREAHAMDAVDAARGSIGMYEIISPPLRHEPLSTEEVLTGREWVAAYRRERADEAKEYADLTTESDYVHLLHQGQGAGTSPGDPLASWRDRGFSRRATLSDGTGIGESEEFLTAENAHDGATRTYADVGAHLGRVNLSKDADATLEQAITALDVDAEAADEIIASARAARREDQALVAATLAQDARIEIEDTTPAELIAEADYKRQTLPLSTTEAAAVMRAQYESGMAVRPEFVAYSGWDDDAGRIEEGTSTLLRVLADDERDRRRFSATGTMPTDPATLAQVLDQVNPNQQMIGTSAPSVADVEQIATVSARSHGAVDPRAASALMQSCCQTPGVAADVAAEFDRVYAAERVQAIRELDPATVIRESGAALNEMESTPLTSTTPVSEVRARSLAMDREAARLREIAAEHPGSGVDVTAEQWAAAAADARQASFTAMAYNTAATQMVTTGNFARQDVGYLATDQFADELRSRVATMHSAAATAGGSAGWSARVAAHRGDVGAAAREVVAEMAATRWAANEFEDRIPQGATRRAELHSDYAAARAAVDAHRSTPSTVNMLRVLSMMDPKSVDAYSRDVEKTALDAALTRSGGRTTTVEALGVRLPKVSPRKAVERRATKEEVVQAWSKVIDDLDADKATPERPAELLAAAKSAVVLKAQQLRQEALATSSPRVRAESIAQLKALVGATVAADLDAIPLVVHGDGEQDELF